MLEWRSSILCQRNNKIITRDSTSPYINLNLNKLFVLLFYLLSLVLIVILLMSLLLLLSLLILMKNLLFDFKLIFNNDRYML